MKEQIVLKAKVDIDFEYILKLIQDGIKDDVETGYLEKERGLSIAGTHRLISAAKATAEDVEAITRAVLAKLRG